jgi:hypothetical protein
MWLAVKPFIMRMPVGWSCCVGLRYRGGHDEGTIITDPVVNGMAWTIEWQKAELSHASASFIKFGMNIIQEVSTEDLLIAIGDDRMEQMILHVCQRVDPRTRVHDFNPDTMKGMFYQILQEQCVLLPPGQDVPESIKHLPEDEILQRLANVLESFLQTGAPEDYPYDKQGSKVMETQH